MTLRTPRFADAGEWRRIRLADQELIEPFWDHSELSWPDRHTRGAWLRECVSARRRMRNRSGLHTVIEVDGRLAGQCDAWIDLFHCRSELGLWVASRHAGDGVGTVAVQLVIAYLFEDLGVERITAPIAKGNTATARIAQRLGFVCEGVMRSYMSVGGQRRDHALWSLIRADWPRTSTSRLTAR
ncbi:GNAT family N-acetyltransferase [Mycobacterium hubeiense]|uniref:GNAT family N-acetyltransferase n=1 Tax=Mycobacterium hubeiense TaxID=1867256 RepID=UPI001E2FC69E|nr:GNAT family protein [Mycobacterium sp. QGD 101]